ncbi:ribonuclease PH [Slackia faecicanis]|uniref:Ribonuclease PH n=1 Tax=Slackia faecicanis TaxID=255723 RepID=A0A3N0AFP4_9ACTN|nr:ribonuclease PH [Slackia faecicanis]MDO5358930.1 ribonuclease PH [Slackia faecicanis]RNL20613.1 ribonuclease PH [Slackia faecicanis]
MFGTRTDHRKDRALRPVSIERNVMKNAAGSCLVKFGDTHVLCSATIEERVGAWRKGSGMGWLTAEYAMLPASTAKRTPRETKGRKGRSQEIERLIGRSLRNVCDMSAMGGEITMTIDCDVLQADGGTRTAAITGAWVAAHDAFEMWRAAGKVKTNPLFGQVAAVSVGLVGGRLLLDLDYREDSQAEIDMNVVMNAKGEFVEVQGTGEQVSFSRERLNEMLDMAQEGIEELLRLQREALEAVK